MVPSHCLSWHTNYIGAQKLDNSNNDQHPQEVPTGLEVSIVLPNLLWIIVYFQPPEVTKFRRAAEP